MLFIRINGIQMLLLPCLCNVLLQYLDEAIPNPLGKLHFLQNFGSLFISFLNLLQREEPLIHVLHDQPSELVHTLMMGFLKQSVVVRRLEIPCCLWMYMDNRLKYVREMEISESTSKTLKKLRQEQKKEP